MKIVVTGSHGLVGSVVVETYRKRGHDVYTLVRSAPNPNKNEIYWDPAALEIDRNGLENKDAIIHLGGASIFSWRWTREKMDDIRQSRMLGTQLLTTTLTQLRKPPNVYVCASAVGYYGHRGALELTEESASGRGFLAEVCRIWEEATHPARQYGIRVVNTRFGIILSNLGGAIPKMLPVFRMGLGGTLGNGEQFMSWITLNDVIDALYFILYEPSLAGPVNVCSPQPVTNRIFTQTLGNVLHRPTLMSVPAPVLRAITGPLADELLLPSTRTYPRKLVQTGYQFLYADLQEALNHVLYEKEVQALQPIETI